MGQCRHCAMIETMQKLVRCSRRMRAETAGAALQFYANAFAGAGLDEEKPAASIAQEKRAGKGKVLSPASALLGKSALLRIFLRQGFKGQAREREE